MDQILEERLDKIFSEPQVLGVISSDMKGLCIGKKGQVNERLAGQIASLHHDACAQWKRPPVAVIEMSSVSGLEPAKVVLTNLANDVCTAVVKTAVAGSNSTV